VASRYLRVFGDEAEKYLPLGQKISLGVVKFS